LFSLIDAAHALGAPPEGSDSSPLSFLGPLPMLVLMFLVLYLLILRPQMKKQKAQQKMVDELQKGDAVVTSGGVHGVITNLKDDIIVLKIADNVKVELSRAAVSRVKSNEGKK